jgi:hypothetical protein
VAIEALAAREAVLSSRLHRALVLAIVNAWRALPGIDDAAMARWLATVLPLVSGAQRQAGAITAAYLTRSLNEGLGGSEVRSVNPELIVGAIVRQGVAPETVYQRPMIQLRSLIGAGLPFGEAARQSQRRAVGLAATDLQLARTHAARAILSRERRVVGYRRTLTGTESCGLCQVASTQRYRREELLPTHPGCNCGVAPIIGTDDPGRVINQPLLEQIHDRVAEEFGVDAVDQAAGHDIHDRDHPYRRLIEVYDHGEYGPTLAKAGQRHLTSAAASSRPDAGDFKLTTSP